MLLLPLAYALTRAVNALNTFVEIPVDLILPIVANIGSFKDLVALNLTSKSIYPIIRPIFDFSTACQIQFWKTWPSFILVLDTDNIHDLPRCANHLMRYSSLYISILMRGHPKTVTALFSLFIGPIQPSVEVIFVKKSLDLHALHQLIQSIKFGVINLDMNAQVLNQQMFDLLADSLDRRSSSNHPFRGLVFDLKYPNAPNLTMTSFFNSLSHSNLKELILDGSLHTHALTQLAAVVSQSKLSHFAYFISGFKPSDIEMQTLGAALVRTPTMKQISIQFSKGYNASLFMSSVVFGLPYSNIFELNIIDGEELDVSVASLKSLPSSLIILEISGSRFTASTVVSLFGVVSRSNVQEFDLSFNSIQLSSKEIGEIRNAIEESQLKYIGMPAFGIGAEEMMLLKRNITNSFGRKVEVMV